MSEALRVQIIVQKNKKTKLNVPVGCRRLIRHSRVDECHSAILFHQHKASGWKTIRMKPEKEKVDTDHIHETLPGIVLAKCADSVSG